MVNSNNYDMIRILICGDQISFRQKTRLMVKQAREMELVAETKSIEEMIRKSRELSPDFIILFISHSNMEWEYAVNTIKSENPSIKFLILSERIRILIKAVKEGLCGYTINTTDSSKLTNLVRRVKKNEIVFPGMLLKEILHEYKKISSTKEITNKSAIKLTKREVDILRLLVLGKRTNDIAKSLVITEKTVHLHIGNILKKFHCNTRQEAVVCALQQGYLNEDKVISQ